jgi:MinD superfamily P-loop ATPase
VTFPELCHGCGACSLACPSDAIAESRRSIGTVAFGRAADVGFVEGTLSVGEVAATPVIRAVKSALPEDGLVVMDAPPGIACPAVETIRGADLLLLVTEPTPFGLHDLRLAVETARALDIKPLVVINRCDIGDGRVSAYCREEGIDVLTRIPNSRTVAEVYARGELPLHAAPAFRESIATLRDTVLQRTQEPMRT